MAVAGKMTFIGEFDGRRLYAETVASAKSAGAAGGAAYSSDFGKKFDAFSGRLRNRFVQIGRENGLLFSKSFTDRVSNAFTRAKGLAGDFGSKLSDGMARARSVMDTVALKTMYLRDHLASLSDSKTLGPFSKLFNVFRRSAGGALDEAATKSDKLGKSLDKTAGSGFWNRIPQNGRQVIFWTSAIASASGEIAVLGSAIGSGLAAGVTVLGALATAGIVAAVGLKGVMGEVSKLPKDVQASATSIQALVQGFKDMQGPIQSSLLQGLAGPIDAVRTNIIPALQSGLVGIAITMQTAFGGVLQQLASPAAATKLSALLAGFRPIIASLISAVASFSSALTTVFIASLPMAQRFAAYLADIGQKFNSFLSSDAGTKALDSFFQHGQMIFSALGPLIAATGKLLGGLVTPETVAATTTFMNVLTQFMPILGQLLGAISQLSLINILAQVLLTVGQAIQPILPQLGTFAGLIGGAITTALQILGPVISTIVTALAPFLDVLNQLIAAVLPPIMTLLQGVGNIVAGVLAQALQAILPLFTMLVPVFNQIITALTPIISAILPPLATLIGALMPVLTPVISLFTSLLGPILDLISPLLQLIGPILNPLIQLLTILMNAVMPVVTAVIKALTPVVTGVANAIGSVLIPVIKTITTVLGGLINFITGVFTGNWKQAWEGIVQIFNGIVGGITDIFRGIVNGAVDIINGLIGGINSISGAVGIPAIPKIPHWASGALLTSPTFGLAGEAGPEAIVPLNRPLSQVDPAVRGLSAIAQGKAAPAVTAGGAAPIVNFEAGSIVSPYSDPALVAEQAADKVAEKLAV